MPITPGQRDYYREGLTNTQAISGLNPSMQALYGNATQGYSGADLANYTQLLNGIYAANRTNTAEADAQTIQSNRNLRDANLADVTRTAGGYLQGRQLLNSDLYGNLGQFSAEATGAVGRDMDALRRAQAKQLSPEDIRNSQQAAREAWSARGLVNSRGAVGSEILNRDSLARQRENEARGNVQQSMGNLFQSINAQQANLFDPQEAVLSSRYGQQTGNAGTNAALYGQGADAAAGRLGNAYGQRVVYPYNDYSNDVYGTNVNAGLAAQISAANNAAAVEAAKLSGQYKIAGSVLDNSSGIYDIFKKLFGGG